jgi:ABC-type sugar transport system ATPase subunit
MKTRPEHREPAVVVEAVSKSFRAVHAVVDVSFTIDAGERLAIIGENGAGKSSPRTRLTWRPSSHRTEPRR